MSSPRPYRIRFWGVRGSMPSPACDHMGYGGNTSCVELAISPEKRVVFDAGSGFRDLGQQMIAERPEGPHEILLFLTHYHYDHVQGIPFFAPLHGPATRLSIHGHRPGGQNGVPLRTFLERFFEPPLFPVSLAGSPSQKIYTEIGTGPIRIDDLVITPVPLHHPQGATGYRVDHGGSSLLYLTDHEHGDSAVDAAIVDAARGAGTLIIDSQYTPEEYKQYRGWGHATWTYAVELAQSAGVGRLILFHHNPLHSDTDMDRILEEARAILPRTDAAREGMELEL